MPGNGWRRAGRYLAIAAVWTAAVLAVLACALAAYLGRVNWGDGSAKASTLELIALGAVGCASVAAALWLTRRLRP